MNNFKNTFTGAINSLFDNLSRYSLLILIATQERYAKFWGLPIDALQVQDIRGLVVPFDELVRHLLVQSVDSFYLAPKVSARQLSSQQLLFSEPEKSPEGETPLQVRAVNAPDVRAGTLDKLVDWMTNVKYPGTWY
jgi:hypothetical protein